MSEVPDWITEVIRRAKSEQHKWLSLGHYDLTSIPTEIFELSNLETLSLAGTSIEVVPNDIRRLRNLKRLHLEGTPLKEVPDIPGLVLDREILRRFKGRISLENVIGLRVDTDNGELPAEVFDLDNLTILDLSNNALTSPPASLVDLVNLEELTLVNNELSGLPEYFAKMTSLKLLFLGGNPLGSFPEVLLKLGNLEALNLDGCRLTSIPDAISKLKNLESLSLSENSLVAIPDSLASLGKLAYFDLGNAGLSEIPDCIYRLNRLRSLSFSNFVEDNRNHIKTLSPEILRLEALEYLSLFDNPTEVPPPEVVNEGLDAIKNYFRQLEEEGQDYLCEAKLLIVGEGGAGKTSLARKIEDPGYELREDEDSTEGIEVVEWTFPAEIPVRRGGEVTPLERDFRVNIWDFGGQEIYHSTHQFFLTKRSLYALVADARKEDTDFYYWLNVVELLSDESPLLIIKNEKQNRKREINESQLRGRFANLKETLATNLADNRGLTEVVQTVKHYISNLPHVGTPLPKTWRNVRKALEGDRRDYMGLDEYVDVCDENGFTRLEDKLQLSGYLHDLGICLHFQDDPLLKKTVILKPRWGTDAVYKVLDDKAVIESKGRFSRDSLGEIWSDPRHAGMRDELLQLMINFKLAYRIGTSDEYIAPQLLKADQPRYPWDEAANLILRYTYDFMPKGLLTQLIVALHPLIERQEWVWREGVVLAKAGARAEAIEHYGLREIRVRVGGKRRKELLTIVAYEFDNIHRSYPRLKLKKLIPCNCSTCKGSQEPHFYSFDILQKFTDDGQLQIQCQESYRMVGVASLIDDIGERHRSQEAARGIERFRPRRHVGPAPVVQREKQIFVSYAWGGESEEIVNRLEEAFQERGVTIVRDKRDLKFKGRIKEFMERIGQGSCVVVVISDKYLKSENCMFELAQIAQHGDFYDRIFPIVLSDAAIFKATRRIRYVKHWEGQVEELDEAMKGVSSAHLQGFREDIDLYAEIRSTIAGLTDILRDMNTLTPEMHDDSGFAELFEAVEAKLGS